MISDHTKTDIKKAATATKTAAQAVVQDGQATAVDMAMSAKDQVESTATLLKDKASDIVGDMKDAAAAARNAAGNRVDAAKETIADQGHKLAENLRTAASDRGETVQGRVLDAVAGGVDHVADSLQGRSITAIFSDVQALARRNPGAFVAGAAVVGFALARFLRAGAHDSGRQS